MNKENKFKIVFGKKMTQEQFSQLQQDSKLLKPASISKLLGKRNWKLQQIPEQEDSKNSKRKKLKIKKKKITRRMSFCDEATPPTNLIKHSNKRSADSPSNLKQQNRKYHKKQSHCNHQLKIAKTHPNALPTAENVENYLAYDLCKRDI